MGQQDEWPLSEVTVQNVPHRCPYLERESSESKTCCFSILMVPAQWPLLPLVPLSLQTEPLLLGGQSLWLGLGLGWGYHKLQSVPFSQNRS